MARPYSMDLRERVVQAVDQEGLSRRQAAERFGIGIKTAIDWLRRFRETGSMAAKPMGGLPAEEDRWSAPRLAARALSGAGLHPARVGRRTGRAWLASRLPDGLGLRSQREAQL